MVASALEYFKDSLEQNAEIPLALSQYNSVLDSLNKMNKRLMREPNDFRVVVSPVEWPTYQSIGATSSTFAS